MQRSFPIWAMLVLTLLVRVTPAAYVSDYFIYMTPSETVRTTGGFASTISQSQGMMAYGSTDEGMSSAAPTNLLVDGPEDLFFRTVPHGLPPGVTPAVATWGLFSGYGAVDFASIFAYDASKPSARWTYEARIDGEALSPDALAASLERTASQNVFDAAIEALRRNISEYFNSSSAVLKNASAAYPGFAPHNLTVSNRTATVVVSAVALGDGIFAVSGSVAKTEGVRTYTVRLDKNHLPFPEVVVTEVGGAVNASGGNASSSSSSPASSSPSPAVANASSPTLSGFVALFERTRVAVNATAAALGHWQRVAYVEGNVSFAHALAICASKGVGGRTFAVGSPDARRVDIFASDGIGSPWTPRAALTSANLSQHLSATSHFGASLAFSERALVIGAPDAIGSSSAVFVFAIDVDPLLNTSRVRASPSCALTHAGERLGTDVAIAYHEATSTSVVVGGRPDGNQPGVHAWRFTTDSSPFIGGAPAIADECVAMNGITGFKMGQTDETATAVGYGDETMHFGAPMADNKGLGVVGLDGRLYVSKYCFPNRERYTPDWWYWHIVKCRDCGSGRYSAGGHDMCHACPATLMKPLDATWRGGAYGCAWRCNAGFAGVNCTSCATLPASALPSGIVPKPVNHSYYDAASTAVQCAWRCSLYYRLSPAGDECLSPHPPAVIPTALTIAAVNSSQALLHFSIAAAGGGAGTLVPTASGTSEVAPVLGFVVQWTELGTGAKGEQTFARQASGETTHGAIALDIVGLWGSTSYEFAAAAYNIGGTGAWSNASVAIVTGPATTPAAPLAPNIPTITSSSLAVFWSSAADHGGARITSSMLCIKEAAGAVSAMGGCSSFVAFVVPPGVEPPNAGAGAASNIPFSALVTGLAAQSLYTISVSTNNTVGASAWSPMVTATTSSLSGLPIAPLGVVNVSATGSTAIVDVLVEDDGGPLGLAFDIEVRANSSGRAPRSDLPTGGATVIAQQCTINMSRTITAVPYTATAEAERAPFAALCVVRRLPALSRIVVKARHAVALDVTFSTTMQWSPPSIEFSTSEPFAPSTPLNFVRDPAFATTASALRVVWDAPYDEGGIPMASYSIRVTPIQGFGVGLGQYSPFLDFSRPAGVGSDYVASSRSLPLSGMTANTTYELALVAVNAINRSAIEATLIVRTELATKPMAPGRPYVDEVLVPSPLALELLWSPSDDLGGAVLAAYHINATCLRVSGGMATTTLLLDVNLAIGGAPKFDINASTLVMLGYDGSSPGLQCTVVIAVSTLSGADVSLRSAWSEALIITLGASGTALLSAPTTPGAPSLVVATGSSLHLEWSLPHGFVTPDTICTLEFAHSPSGPWIVKATRLVGTDQVSNRSAVIDQLSAFTQYWAAVHCSNIVGTGPKSKVIVFNTPAPTQPSPPTALTWQSSTKTFVMSPELDNGGIGTSIYEVRVYSCWSTGDPACAAIADLCVLTGSKSAAQAGWSGTLAEAALTPFAAKASASAAAGALLVTKSWAAPLQSVVNSSVVLASLTPATVYFVRAQTQNLAGLVSELSDVLVIVPGAVPPQAPPSPVLIAMIPNPPNIVVTMELLAPNNPTSALMSGGCAITSAKLFRDGIFLLSASIPFGEPARFSDALIPTRANYTAVLINSIGSSAKSGPHIVTMPVVLPSAPNSIVASDYLPTSLDIEWSMPKARWGGAPIPTPGSHYDIAVVLVSSSSGTVDNPDPNVHIRATAITDTKYSLTDLYPSSTYDLYVRADNTAGHSSWSVPTRVTSAAPYPCPQGGQGNAPCAGHGVCHEWKGTCTCNPGYCGAGCTESDGMTFVLDIVDNGRIPFRHEGLVADLAHPTILNVSSQRLAVVSSQRVEGGALRVRVALRFADFAASPSSTSSVASVGVLCTQLKEMAADGETAKSKDRRLAAIQVVKIMLPATCSAGADPSAVVSAGVCNTLYNVTSNALVFSKSIDRAVCDVPGSGKACNVCHLVDRACGWCGDDADGVCIVGSALGPGRDACVTRTSAGYATFDGKRAPWRPGTPVAWYSPSTDGICPAGCSQIAKCGSCTAQIDRARFNSQQCGWCAHPYRGTCMRANVHTNAVSGALEASRARPSQCAAYKEGATWSTTCIASCTQSAPLSALTTQLDTMEGIIAYGGQGVAYRGQSCNWKVEPKPTNWYDKMMWTPGLREYSVAVWGEYVNLGGYRGDRLEMYPLTGAVAKKSGAIYETTTEKRVTVKGTGALVKLVPKGSSGGGFVIRYKLHIDSSIEIVLYTIVGSTFFICVVILSCLGLRCYILKRNDREDGAPVLNPVEALQVELSRTGTPGTEYTFDQAHAATLSVTEDELCCSICLCEFEDGEECRSLPCMHAFHAECVGMWLERSEQCPLCKANVFVSQVVNRRRGGGAGNSESEFAQRQRSIQAGAAGAATKEADTKEGDDVEPESMTPRTRRFSLSNFLEHNAFNRGRGRGRGGRGRGRARGAVRRGVNPVAQAGPANPLAAAGIADAPPAVLAPNPLQDFGGGANLAPPNPPIDLAPINVEAQFRLPLENAAAPEGGAEGHFNPLNPLALGRQRRQSQAQIVAPNPLQAALQREDAAARGGGGGSVDYGGVDDAAAHGGGGGPVDYVPPPPPMAEWLAPPEAADVPPPPRAAPLYVVPVAPPSDFVPAAPTSDFVPPPPMADLVSPPEAAALVSGGGASPPPPRPPPLGLPPGRSNEQPRESKGEGALSMMQLPPTPALTPTPPSPSPPMMQLAPPPGRRNLVEVEPGEVEELPIVDTGVDPRVDHVARVVTGFFAAVYGEEPSTEELIIAQEAMFGDSTTSGDDSDSNSSGGSSTRSGSSSDDDEISADTIDSDDL